METGETPIGGRALSALSRLVHRLIPWALAPVVFVASLASPLMPAFVAFTPQKIYNDHVHNGTEDLLAQGVQAGSLLALLPAALAGLATLMVRRRRWPVYAMAAIGWLSLCMWPAVIVASYYAATTLRRRAAVAAFTIIAAGLLIVPMSLGNTLYHAELDPAAYLLAVVTAAVLLGMPLFAGLWVNARRHLLAGLRDRAERLEREQNARADAARAEERARIAREMHDVVAHRVSLMVLHAGALEVSTADGRTAEAADLIRTTGREALAELRQVLGMLRVADSSAGALVPQPELVDLDRLIEQSRAAGVPVSRRDEGQLQRLPATVQRTAYRVVQEALTNVHKHAGDAVTEVVLRYKPDMLEIAVENGPPLAPVHRLPGSGLGLVGLRERVELLGGQFHAHRRLDGGFAVLARIPVAQTTELAESA